ncbi:MAG: DM13 domain-containing protein [Cyclobacteriaceae bacterium]|nr:DM13 domain-containing protein [Cyclobacteriaceae bacterium]
MKNLFVIFLILLLGCGVEEATPTKPANDNFMTDAATKISMGSIMGINHTVSGTATVYKSDGEYTLVLDPFQSQNGPDLKVYLSKDIGAKSFIRLGVLKSTTGKQAYAIPSSITLAEYPYAHIWCEAFSVEFARAMLN